MGRLPVYGPGWKQRVYSLPIDVGLEIQRAVARSGVSADGICRVALRAEQEARGGVLTPWVDVAERPVRVNRGDGRAKAKEAQDQVWRVGVKMHDGWKLKTDRRGVAGLIVAGVERLRLFALDGDQIRDLAGLSLPPPVVAQP